jgi:putative DNA primase/helicase
MTPTFGEFWREWRERGPADFDPLVDLTIRLDRACDREQGCRDRCVGVIEPGSGPHCYALHCAGCGRHRGWLPRRAAALLRSLYEVGQLSSAPILRDQAIVRDLSAQMTVAGIEPPAEFVVDGELHRFVSTLGHKSATGWYIIHNDPAGAVWSFGDWRLGIKERGEGDPGRILAPEEIAERRQRIHELQIKIAAWKAELEAVAAIEAQERWDCARPAPPRHPYLKSKGITPCGVRIEGNKLLVPMRDIGGKLWSLQTIAPDGWKHNQEGGRRKGCFFQVGEMGEHSEPFIIGEGFSTCATLHMASGLAVFSAGDAGNIGDVAEILRAKYPTAIVIIAADDDWLTRVKGKPSNTGKLAATAAARAIDGVLVMPSFHSSGRPRWATDFNDMHKLHGLDEVAARVRLALVAHREAREAHQETRQETKEAPQEARSVAQANGCAAQAVSNGVMAPIVVRPAVRRTFGILRTVMAAPKDKHGSILHWAARRISGMISDHKVDQQDTIQVIAGLREAARRAGVLPAEIDRAVTSIRRGASGVLS